MSWNLLKDFLYGQVDVENRSKKTTKVSRSKCCRLYIYFIFFNGLHVKMSRVQLSPTYVQISRVSLCSFSFVGGIIRGYEFFVSTNDTIYPLLNFLDAFINYEACLYTNG